MSFAAPALLAALAVLPLLWWLLRATPPAPRVQPFPAIRLLLGLRQNEETPRHTPLWLLALRLGAAALLIVGLAGPLLGRTSAPSGTGHNLLLVVDNGWASAHDWPRRLAAADAILAGADRAGLRVAVLATARDDDGAAPALSAFLPASAARRVLAAIRPHPWSCDRAGAARALGDLAPGSGSTPIRYVADGVATDGDRGFAAALDRIGHVVELRDTAAPSRLLLPPQDEEDGMIVRLASAGTARPATALALDGRGGALARIALVPHGNIAAGRVTLPLELRNQLARIVVPGAPSAATTRLLDESDRRRPIGLLAGDPGSETPLTGALFFIERALGQDAELRHGTLDALLARKLSVLIAADASFNDPDTSRKLTRWVEGGGMLIRFAGPLLAARSTGGDAASHLLPVPLMPGARALGGAMSWTRPQHLAPFPPSSPLAGLAIPSEVTVSRQVLARPTVDLASHSWAMLADGTPLVTARRLGRGQIVLFHVTANADWSNLPLSGLFVGMLERLVRLASGIAAPGDHTLLAPVATLDAGGLLGEPGPAASGVPADAFGTLPASPRHPPGLYGRLAERRALNTADMLPPLAAESPVGTVVPLSEHAPVEALGPWLIGAALALLAVDLIASLGVRGLLRASVFAAGLLIACAVGGPGERAWAVTPDAAPRAALQTELGYVVTGNADVDRVSQQGLSALSDYVNARTAATLGEPSGVRPGQDDLAFYPLLYWPILPDAAPDARALAALDAYMRAGGIVLIDTEGSSAGDPDAGSGAGFAPGVEAALKRVASGLDVPPLAPLTPTHVLAHSFYLLRDFPGRFAGAPVWVARAGDPTNDGVSPIIIGANGWAASWAQGADGQPEFAAIPGGEQQRTMAYRFGVNLVMYALTGNYKADQVHVPALLQRLGQDEDNDADGDQGGNDAPAIGK